MKRLGKAFAALVLCILTAGFAATTVFAAEVVKKVEISVTNGEKNDSGIYVPEVYASRSRVDDIQFSKDEYDWRAGDTITLSITLSPRDGYSFSSSKTSVTCTGDGKLANKSITAECITAKVNYKLTGALKAPTGLYVDVSGSGRVIAHWDKVDGAKKYEVTVYSDSTENTITVDTNSADISAYATEGDEDAATFKVRAVPTDAQKKYLERSQWTKYGEGIEIGGDNTEYGHFEGSGNYRRFVTYRDESGTTNYASGWQFLNGYWYYFFPQTFYAAQNWQLIGGKWYYFHPEESTDGIPYTMATGWVKVNGLWYYLESSGAMRTGWVQPSPNGPMYYLDTVTGAMWANATTPDGYAVGADGARITANAAQQPANGTAEGFYDNAEKRFYRLGNGTNAASCWQLIKGEWYYFGADGAMLTGWQWIDGNRDGVSECYYLNPLKTGKKPYGAMYANTTTPDGYRVNADGAWIDNGKVMQKRK